MAISALAAPPWFVRTWQSDEGLPDNTVVGIDQTPDGFLWVATQTGVVRFDGLQFRNLPIQMPERGPGSVHALCTDRRGRVWVGLERGAVVCVDQGRTTLVLPPSTTRADQGARMLVEDGEGAVWVSFDNGEVVRLKDGVARSYEGVYAELTVDVTGRLWFLRSDQVGVFREDKFCILAKIRAGRICSSNKGGVWLCSSTSLLRYTEPDGIVESVSLSMGDSNPAPTVVLEDHSGRIWIGTRVAGLFYYDGKEVRKVETAEQTILNIKEGREGNLWVGTRGGGLKQLKPRVAEWLAVDSKTPFEGIQSICKDRSGQLWAVTWHKGTVIRNVNQEWIRLSASDGWRANFSKCVAADPNGGVWIGTRFDGLFHWQDGQVTSHYTSTNGLKYDWVRALCVTETGELWLGNGDGSVDACLLRYKDGSFRAFPLPKDSGAIWTIEVDASGSCWVGTGNGMLFRVTGDVLSDETWYLQAEAPCPIRSLRAAPDNSLWIGFAGIGLGRIKNGHFTRLGSEEGLYDDYLSNILSDGHGRLWLAGNRGIFSMSEQELDDLEAGRIKQVQSVVFKQDDGLPGLQASFEAWPGAFRDKEGRLFFSMLSGVAIMNTEAITKDSMPPQVVIDKVTANAQPVARYWAGHSQSSAHGPTLLELGQANAHLRLSPGQRQVAFTFTVPSFTMPENNRFKYRLQGLDKDWLDAGMLRSILYSQLAPGRYCFQVTACNRDGVWNKQGATLALTVPPLWWETAWFRIGGPLFLFGMVGALVVLWLRRRQQLQLERLEMQRATEKERMRIAQDLHDDLGSNLAEIAMVSELAQSELPEGDPSQKQFNAIFIQAEDNVRRLREIVWAINPFNDTLERFVGHLCKFAQDHLALAQVRCRLDIPENVPDIPFDSVQRHNLMLATKEAIHNAVRHGAPSELIIRFAAEGGKVVITIEDNGRGFDTTQSVAAYRGTDNMIARMKKIGGTFARHSTPGKGTTVILSAPFTIPKAKS